jgi:hypothetical protein
VDSWIPRSENPDIHPTDEDLSAGTPDIHPTDEDLSAGTPDMGHPACGSGDPRYSRPGDRHYLLTDTF